MKHLTVTVPTTHYQVEAQNQYNHISEAMTREFLQNSTDAGSKTVSFELDADTVVCSDTGTGLTIDQFQDRMLTLGISHKAAGAVGGFGAAKKLLLFAHDRWTVTGQDFECSGQFHENIYATSASRSKGLRVEAQSCLIEQEQMSDAIESLMCKSRIGATVKVNGVAVKQGRKLRGDQVVEVLDCGTLYCHKGLASDAESRGQLIIRTNGLYSTTKYVGGAWVWYLDIDKGNSKDVLTESRDNLRPQHANRVHAVVSAVNSLGRTDKRKVSICDVFGVQFQASGEEHPEVDGLQVNAKGESFVPQAEVASYGAEQPPDQQASPIAGVLAQSGGEQGTGEQQEADGQQEATYQADATGESDTYSPAHTPETQRVNLAQSWRKPYAIMADGKPPRVFTNEGLLKPKFAKAMEIVSTTLNLLADALEVTRPIPAIMFSEEAIGRHIGGANGQHIIGLGIDLVLEGSAFEIMSCAIHEFGHYTESDHTSWFLREKERLERRVGPTAMAVLSSITVAQAQKRQAKGHWLI